MTEHPPEIQEVLRRAGMSVRSELTPAELQGAYRAAAWVKTNPNATRDTIYRTIRPRRGDE